MDFNQLFKGLTDQQKKELREAKTKEELDALVTSAGMELSEDQLSSVAGGCFDPECDHCPIDRPNDCPSYYGGYRVL